MSQSQSSKDYLYGVPELLVLRLISGKQMYGYEIVQGIKDRTNGEIQFAEGVIYPLLHSMHKRRLLAIRKETVNGRQRIYYRLTNAGEKKLAAKASEWFQVADVIRTFLSGGANETVSN